MLHISPADVLLAQEREVTDALELLEEAVPHLRFNSEIFRWNLALGTGCRVGRLAAVFGINEREHVQHDTYRKTLTPDRVTGCFLG